MDGRRALKRISNISTAKEIDLEWKREGLRNSRWKRLRSKIYAGLACVVVLGAVFLEAGGPRVVKLLPIF